MNVSHLIETVQTILLKNCRRTLAEADAHQVHNALGEAVLMEVTPEWKACEDRRANGKQAAYISCEYLMGRLVGNNLLCLGILGQVRDALGACGFDIARFEEIEDDAFGNGGLGRLAACFLDSAAALDVPLRGYGLRYRYGLFRQSFAADGSQAEEPDDWARFGDPWSVRRDDLAVIVPMKTGDVRAVPYDVPIIGWQGKSIGTLRLWQTESLSEIDFELFNSQLYRKACAGKNYGEDIVKFLYPNDTLRAGKLMRIKQQYVLSSATVQDILRSFRETFGDDYRRLPEFWAVQLNDTHPVMAIPELIRLLKNEGMPFEEAFGIAQRVFSYTNHTVMQEALEKWDLSLLRAVAPDMAEVILEIDRHFRNTAKALNEEVSGDFCVTEGRRVHMAQLAVYCTHRTNGVAMIHSGILKDSVFRRWHAHWPERFDNKTNGITPRRWLALCNPELTELLEETIGSGFVGDLSRIGRLSERIDSGLAMRFHQIKQLKKGQLSAFINQQEGIEIPADFLFDIQVKRLHEYKRQLMNALSILAIHRMLKSGELTDFTPTAFIFGAKAAPGYVRAKAVIRFINQIARKVNADPDTRDRLRVAFLHDYNCSKAEIILPAADVSEQISPAGTEASGTGNMKLMLNGAVTLGTWDGANIEIVQEAGAENNYVFGARVEELNEIRDTYDPTEIYDSNEILRGALDQMIDGTFPDPDGSLRELYDSLLKGASWHRPDHYFVLRDFASYLEAKLRANRDYRDTAAFSEKCLRNIAGAGKFSSDRTIREYAKEIWGISCS
ncbi:MAG: glycogen/starch/alpha-glucan family phosphorylase [Clostridia bacterium]|nr:glycogen/starch/alpha-glucan family phosphorylase [Clostridia bacterium]